MKRKLCALFLIGTTLILTRKFLIWKRCECKKNIFGKVIVITGATSGIGFALAKELAIRGATLILGCRDLKAAAHAQEIIIKATGNPSIFVKHLDLASFDSITKFTSEISEFPSVYALVNNAGIFYHPPENSRDNFEVTFQTNYLGPFLLTLQLIPSLRKERHHSRIVHISSQAHLNCDTLPDLYLHNKYVDSRENRFLAYQYSKFCLVLFAKRLDQLLEATNTTVHCVNPGNTETRIIRHFPQLSNKFLFLLQAPIRFFVIKTPNEAAQSVLHCLLAPQRPPFYIEHLSGSTNITDKVNNPIYLNEIWRISRKCCRNHLTSAN